MIACTITRRNGSLRNRGVTDSDSVKDGDACKRSVEDGDAFRCRDDGDALKRVDDGEH